MADADPPALFTNEELWRHPDPHSTQMWQFLQAVNKQHSLDLTDYDGLYQWSVEHISDFWSAVADFTGLKADLAGTKAVDESAPMFPRPPFFEGGRMNFAENLLYPPGKVPDASKPALLAATETLRESVSWAELRKRVARCQGAMQAVGVGKLDRVAGYVGNHVEAVVFMLAATSLGAIWTAVSPDSGVSMVMDRLRQIEPVLLVADAEQEYNGKRHNVLSKVAEVVSQLPSLKTVVILSETADAKAVSEKHLTHSKFLSQCPASKSEEPTFAQLPPDHPVYILYSSGTTGAPKCIVHGAVGTVLQHKKEHQIQSDIQPGDRLFYFTTVTWMMWHWLVSGLASGATLILYDGSPMRYRSTDGSSQPDDLAMPRLISELKINQFGTSAKYLSLLEQKAAYPMRAPHSIDLSSLRAIYNTASPLAPSTFRYVYAAFPPTLNLASITGGTDIISLFGAPSPLVPVFAGELQARGLGMAVHAYASDSPRDAPEDITLSGAPGDLVCARPFICMPVGFWPLDSAAGTQRYRGAYFERFNDTSGSGSPVWHHGDYVALNPRTRGMLMLGRSDGVLNPAGVRFGSAEMYNVLLARFAGVVADGLCVGRRRKEDADEAVVLFVKMEGGHSFDDALRVRICRAVREELSARHVPAFVDECPDIPVTVNGKKVEGAVKKIVSGDQASVSASVANPECLEFYRKWAGEH